VSDPSLATEAATSTEMDDLLGMLHAKRYADSESFARALLPKHPNSGYIWKTLGISLWMQGKDSRRAFYNVTRLEPDDPEGHCNLGHVLLEFGQPQQAAQSARRALQLDPRLAEAHSNLGNALRQLGDIEAAVASYHAALALQPGSASAHNNLGTALQALGRMEEAIASYRAALSIQGNLAEAHNNLGNALRLQGRLTEAADSYRDALRIRAAFPEAHSNLGNVLLDLNQPHEAIASYRRALEVNPSHAEAHNNLGNALLTVGELDSAQESCQRALAIRPRFPEAHNNLGNIHRARADLARAAASYGEALAINPDYAEAHNHLGQALLGQWRIEEAILSYQRALALKPQYADAHLGLALAQSQLWRVHDAIASCQRALAIRPDFAEAQDHLGCMFLEVHELEQAEANLRKAIALDPALAPAHCNLGHALRRLRRSEEAAASARRALEIDPQLPDAYYLLAQISADHGDFAQAELLLQQASVFEPEIPILLANVPAMRTMTGDDQEWLASVRAMLSRPLSPRQALALHMALGKYFDDVGNCGEAFASYRQAKEIAKKYRPGYDAEGHTRHFDAVMSALSPAWVQRRRTVPVGSERAVFVVGMPRSGTTLVEQILASHPDVFGAGEEAFWDQKAAPLRSSPAAVDLSDGSVGKMAEEYLQWLKRVSPDALRVVNKLSANYRHLGLIHAALPRARIIHMRRHPVATGLSVYFHPFALGHPYANDLGTIAHYYREYARLMAHWRSNLPGEAMLEVPYESLVSDPQQWTRRLIEFIGLPWHPKCLEFHATERPVMVINSRWQVRQPMFTTAIDHWRQYEHLVEPLLPLAELS